MLPKEVARNAAHSTCCGSTNFSAQGLQTIRKLFKVGAKLESLLMEVNFFPITLKYAPTIAGKVEAVLTTITS